MADRTSAEVFGVAFRLLAKEPSDENKAIARRLWELRSRCDFSPYQMRVDDALISLDLAKRVSKSSDPENPFLSEAHVLYLDRDF